MLERILKLDYWSVHVSPPSVYDSDGDIDAPDFMNLRFGSILTL